MYKKLILPLGDAPITKNHPLSCYTSRKIDYSAKLNEILNQEELSSIFVIDEEKEYNNETTLLLSESLGIKFLIFFLEIFHSYSWLRSSTLAKTDVLF